jgi:HEAT repeat protein
LGDARCFEPLSAALKDPDPGMRSVAARALGRLGDPRVVPLLKEALAEEGIDALPALAVGAEADLIRTLEQASLPAWKTRTDALPQQFARAVLAAAKRLEPKTQNVRLTSGTLRTENEVRAWLAETERELLDKLNDGPIVIS